MRGAAGATRNADVGRSVVIILKAIGIWALILACAVANGALREAVLIPRFGLRASLLVSGLLLCTCVVVVSFMLVPRLGQSRLLARAGIGALWLAMTLAFEFGFGRLVEQRSWESLFEAYTFKDGNLWLLVLLATLISPMLAPMSKAGR